MNKTNVSIGGPATRRIVQQLGRSRIASRKRRAGANALQVIDFYVNKMLVLFDVFIDCVSQVALSIVAVLHTYDRYTKYQIYMMYIASFLIYWNGIFFMNMVCADYANVNLKKQLHIL